MNFNLEDKIKSSCWTVEGLWGDMSCPILKDCVHCFNCKVYAAAGKVLFDKDASKRRRELPSESAKEAKSPDEAKGKTKAFFVFRLGKDAFAIDLKAVARVTHPRAIHRIPHRDGKVICGLVNIGGEIIPAVSLCDILGIPRPDDSAEKCRMFVCRFGEDAFAFSTNQALGVFRIAVADISNAEENSDAYESAFVEKCFRIGSQTVSELDVQLLFHAIIRKFL